MNTLLRTHTQEITHVALQYMLTHINIFTCADPCIMEFPNLTISVVWGYSTRQELNSFNLAEKKCAKAISNERGRSIFHVIGIRIFIEVLLPCRVNNSYSKSKHNHIDRKKKNMEMISPICIIGVHLQGRLGCGDLVSHSFSICFYHSPCLVFL